MPKRIGARGIVGAFLAGVIGLNEFLGLMGRANLLDRMLSHAFGWQVTPTFNLLVLATGLGLILAELRRQSSVSPPTSVVPTTKAIRPRIVARDTRSIMIDTTECSMGPGKQEDALTASLVAFEYDPVLAEGPRVVVRAELSFEQQGHKYQGGGKTVHVGSGYWRDATRNQAIYGPGVRHELIVAIEHRGRVTSIQDERADRSDLRPTLSDLGVWPIVSSHVVKINLIMLDEISRQRLAIDTFLYLLSISDFRLDLSPLTGEAIPPNTFATVAVDSLPDEDEIKILQMFVEFMGKHTSENVAKRMSISKHKAEYHLDRIGDMHLIARSFDEYRNGHPVYYIRREGRDLLVRLKLIK